MIYFKRFFQLCFFLILFSSCLQLGLNVSHKTPKKASKLPQFTHKDSLLGAPYQRRICFDVKHYDVDLTIDPSQKSIAGKVTTSFILLQSASQIQLDLDSRLTIDSVRDANSKLTFRRDGTALLVDLKSQQASQAVTVFYHGKPKGARRPPWDGGLVWKKDKDKKPWSGVACEGDGAHLWLPVKLLLSDEPDSADLKFTVPKGLTLISNGVLVARQVGEKTETFHWKTSYPINVYNLTFYLGNYQLLERNFASASGRAVNQQFWVLPEHVPAAAQAFSYCDTVLKHYENLFGDYPWQKEGYKLIESPYEGMEHQTAIAYGSGFNKKANPRFNYIIVHETAHEWWGNSVSVADFSDVWLHEGFATYTEALYMERIWGHAAYLRYMNNIYYSIMNKKPVIGPDKVYYWNYKDGDVYMKGAATLHALRCVLQDDSLFFKVLREFYQQHKMGIANTNQFITLVNQMTGKNLNFLFNHYLYQRASPKLVWTIGPGTSQQETEFLFRMENVASDITVPVKVQSGEKSFYIYPTYETQSFTIPLVTQKLLQINTDKVYLQEVYLKKKKFNKK